MQKRHLRGRRRGGSLVDIGRDLLSPRTAPHVSCREVSFYKRTLALSHSLGSSGLSHDVRIVGSVSVNYLACSAVS